MLPNVFYPISNVFQPTVASADFLQPDGQYGVGLEESLMLRQQLEGSELPNEFKRAQLGATPFWEEVLLDLNRTQKVGLWGLLVTKLYTLVTVAAAAAVVTV